MASLQAIVACLDRELNVEAFTDSSHNGLQVENSGIVGKVCCGVDASMSFFEAAAQEGADLVICHHGISWGDSLRRITELNYRRVKFLLQHNIALYACHLPLDAHRVYGNNACIVNALGLRNVLPFGVYHGQSIGFAGRLGKAETIGAFVKRVKGILLREDDLRVMEFGSPTVKSVAVVSGGAADMVAEAGRKGIDVLLTGEPVLAAYSVAQEYGVHVVFGGHYATETFGVRALGPLLTRQFDVETSFIDMRVPY
ncbi:MAG: Nif3-like dinuclear metal center hexameric protein [Kiritimatiellia bacterium]